MREFRFRVWNGTRMEYSVTTGKFGIFYVNPKNNGIDPNDIASLTPNTTKYDDYIPVMQYTGLEDHEGNELWEGDLFMNGQSLRVIKFHKGNFVAATLDGKEGILLSFIHKGTGNVKVGSIYENPERELYSN